MKLDISPVGKEGGERVGGRQRDKTSVYAAESEALDQIAKEVSNIINCTECTELGEAVLRCNNTSIVTWVFDVILTEFEPIFYIPRDIIIYVYHLNRDQLNKYK